MTKPTNSQPSHTRAHACRYLTQPLGEDGNRYSFLNGVLLAWLVGCAWGFRGVLLLLLAWLLGLDASERAMRCLPGPA